VEWPKQRAGQAVVGVAEVRVVGDVEDLGPEVKPQPFGKVKLTLQGKIRLRSSETPQHVASEIALLATGRRSKSYLIENLAAGILRPIEHKRHSWRYIRAVLEDGARSKRKCTNDIIGRSRSGDHESVQRPAAERSADSLLRSRRGQIVGHASGKRMTDVKVGIPAVYALISTAGRVEVVSELKIERPDEISSTLKKAHGGPRAGRRACGLPRQSSPDGDCASRSAELSATVQNLNGNSGT